MDNLIKAKDQMKMFVNKHRTELSFKVGDRVLLKLQPYKQTTTQGATPQNLSSKYFDSYTILEKIDTVAYRLQLPLSARIHNVFHASQLKKYEGREMRMQCDPPSFWEIHPKEPEAILEQRMVKRGNRAVTRVLIKWMREEAIDATWEDYSVINAKFPAFDLLDEVRFKGEGVSGASLQGPTTKGVVITA